MRKAVYTSECKERLKHKRDLGRSLKKFILDEHLIVVRNHHDSLGEDDSTNLVGYYRNRIRIKVNDVQLKLSRGVDLAVCALDSLDYITDPEACRRAIQRVYKALNPGGIFIFDVNTPQKLRAMDGQVFLDEDDDVYCVWRGKLIYCIRKKTE